jgi:hypothetical protein
VTRAQARAVEKSLEDQALEEKKRQEKRQHAISNTRNMLGKRKERTTKAPTPNLKNEGDIAAGYTVARQLVLEELDLEIRVRQRLKETIESRIGWATCLQTSLNGARENQGASVFQQSRVLTLTTALQILKAQVRQPVPTYFNSPLRMLCTLQKPHYFLYYPGNPTSLLILLLMLFLHRQRLLPQTPMLAHILVTPASGGLRLPFVPHPNIFTSVTLPLIRLHDSPARIVHAGISRESKVS